jgi:predicted phage terminase large subunit-like protein
MVDKVPEPQYVIITGDIATSLGRGDYTAFLVWHYYDEVWYLVAAHRAQLDLPGVVKFYNKLDQEYEPDFSLIEQNGLGAGFVQRMNELGFKYVQGQSIAGDKVERAESITPLLERKQIAFLKTMPLYEKFMDELLSFPSSKNDDMVDALTLALTYRQALLRVANYHRRQKRRHLAQARSSQMDVRISTFGSSSGVRDHYAERMGRSVFSR